MATIHQATLTPTKLELLANWLPDRRWYPGETLPDLDRLGAFRFDDPDGEVGVETLVIRPSNGGPVVQAPLTYRAAPLNGADYFLIGITEHSVLGTRWVYDAVGDPVYLTCLAAAIRTGGREAEEMVQTAAGPRRRDPLMSVRGTGTANTARPAGTLVRVQDGDPAVAVTTSERLEVRRVLTTEPADNHLALTGTWPGLSAPMILATLDGA